jgi:putative transcriptional regulator
MFKLSPENIEQPARGKLLISEPFLQDEIFGRSVVLLCEHNDKDGSFGFVINKFIDVNLQELVENFPSFKGRIGLGGPVNQSDLYFIHTRVDLFPDSKEIIKGLYIGNAYTKLISALNIKSVSESEVRFFIGYSGWSKNQLKGELKEKSWIVASTTVDFVMKGTKDKYWEDALKNMGEGFSHLANFPEDPSLN